MPPRLSHLPRQRHGDQRGGRSDAAGLFELAAAPPSPPPRQAAPGCARKASFPRRPCAPCPPRHGAGQEQPVRTAFPLGLNAAAPSERLHERGLLQPPPAPSRADTRHRHSTARTRQRRGHAGAGGARAGDRRGLPVLDLPQARLAPPALVCSLQPRAEPGAGAAAQPVPGRYRQRLYTTASRLPLLLGSDA